MPVGYSIDVDSSDTLRYSKFHKNGEKTEVQADIVSSAKTKGREQWRAYVTDPNGKKTLGTGFASKKEAKNAMTTWMENHPKGVPASGKGVTGLGGGIPGQDTGIPGNDGNGLF